MEGNSEHEPMVFTQGLNYVIDPISIMSVRNSKMRYSAISNVRREGFEMDAMESMDVSYRLACMSLHKVALPIV